MRGWKTADNAGFVYIVTVPVPHEGLEVGYGRARKPGRHEFPFPMRGYRTEDVAARVLDITGGVGVEHIAEVDFGGNLAATMRCLRID